MSKAYNFLSVTSVGSFYELKPRLTRGEGGEERGKRNSSRMKIKGRDRHCNEKKKGGTDIGREGQGPLFWNPDKR